MCEDGESGGGGGGEGCYQLENVSIVLHQRIRFILFASPCSRFLSKRGQETLREGPDRVIHFLLIGREGKRANADGTGGERDGLLP